MAVKVYENKDLVRIRIKRQFYEQLEEKTKKLGTSWTSSSATHYSSR